MLRQAVNSNHVNKQGISGREKRRDWNFYNTIAIPASLLLFVACSLIAMPEIQENVKSFLLTAFTCVALLQGQ